MEQILLEEAISKHVKEKKVQLTWMYEGEIMSDEPESFLCREDWVGGC